MKYAEFRKLVAFSREAISRGIFEEYRGRIKVKKEKVAVKNLVKIFDATLSLSNARGFHAMSLRDLSRATGLSMGALYSYFSSKEELLDIIQAQGRRITVKVLTEQVGRGQGAAEKLRRGVRSHLYLSEALQPWFYFSYMEAKNLDGERKSQAIESELYTERIFRDILDEGCAQGVFSVGDTQLAAAVIKAVLQDWYLKRWKYSRRRTSVEDYSAFVLDFIESFVAAPREKSVHRRGSHGSDR